MRYYGIVAVPNPIFEAMRCRNRMWRGIPFSLRRVDLEGLFLPSKDKSFEFLRAGFIVFPDIGTARTFADWGRAVLEIEVEKDEMTNGDCQFRGTTNWFYVRRGVMVALHSSCFGAENHLVAPIAQIYDIPFFPHPPELVGVQL